MRGIFDAGAVMAGRMAYNATMIHLGSALGFLDTALPGQAGPIVKGLVVAGGLDVVNRMLSPKLPGLKDRVRMVSAGIYSTFTADLLRRVLPPTATAYLGEYDAGTNGMNAFGAYPRRPGLAAYPASRAVSAGAMGAYVQDTDAATFEGDQYNQ